MVTSAQIKQTSLSNTAFFVSKKKVKSRTPRKIKNDHHQAVTLYYPVLKKIAKRTRSFCSSSLLPECLVKMISIYHYFTSVTTMQEK